MVVEKFTVIGTPYCARCRNIRREFIAKHIVFNYLDLSELLEEDQEEVKQKAKAVGQQQFPIILNTDGNIVNYREVIKQYGIS